MAHRSQSATSDGEIRPWTRAGAYSKAAAPVLRSTMNRMSVADWNYTPTLERSRFFIDIERDVSTPGFLALTLFERDGAFAQPLAHVVTFDHEQHFRHDGIAEIELVGDFIEKHNGELSILTVDKTEIGDMQRLADDLGLIALVASLHERHALVLELCEVTHFKPFYRADSPFSCLSLIRIFD